MAARIYGPLNRYADAAWLQEACLRSQHTYALREGLFPEEIPGYTRNQIWLARTLAKLGRLTEAAETARHLIALPRHPRYNPGTNRGSNYLGRQQLRALLTEYELWEEVLAPATRNCLEAGDEYREQIQQQRCLARAHFRKGMTQRDAAALRAGRAELAKLQEQAGRKRTPSEEREWQDAVEELKALDLLAEDKISEGLRLLPRVRDGEPLFLAEILARAHRKEEAENLLMRQVEERPKEVLPLAHLVALRWNIGRKQEAEKAFRTLRQVAGQADLQTPVLKRICTIAQELGHTGDWRIRSRTVVSVDRPPLASLGLRRWQPPRAPAWDLQDAHGQSHSLEQYQGKPVLLIFYLGSGCLHCVEQIQSFRPKADAFARAGITVLCISTEDGKTLAQALKNFGADKFPFTLLSNAKLDVFQAYRAYDEFQEQPLHGTFLLDGEGRIRWQDTGPEPFVKADFLLSEAQRLLAPKATSSKPQGPPSPN